MESLLHLHPIFEFFLTLYVGFIIAPEFLNKSILERSNIDFEQSKKDKLALLTKIKESYRDECDRQRIVDVVFWDSEFLKKFRNLFEEQCKANEDRIQKTIEITTKEHRDDIIPKVASNLRGYYDRLFVLASLYSFFILNFNGCHWGFESNHEFIFLTSILYFNALAGLVFLPFIYIIFLRSRKPMVNSKPSFIHKILANYRSLHSVLIIFILTLISFWIAYFYSFNFRGLGEIAILSTELICAIPILTFLLTLKGNTSNFMRKEYKQVEIDDANFSFDTFQADLYKGYAERKKVYDEQDPTPK